MPVCLSCDYHIDDGVLCSDCRSRPIISSADSNTLKVLLAEPPRLSPLIQSALREKLDTACVLDEADVPHDVVTINSRVLYRIDDGPAEWRTLVAADAAYVPGHSLPVTTPAGAALIGLAEGHAAPLPSLGGRVRMVKVVELIWQPAKAHRRFFTVHSSDTDPHRSAAGNRTVGRSWPARTRVATQPDHDDPGPRAA